jgi:hypothetical protein
VLQCGSGWPMVAYWSAISNFPEATGHPLPGKETVAEENSSGTKMVKEVAGQEDGCDKELK